MRPLAIEGGDFSFSRSLNTEMSLVDIEQRRHTNAVNYRNIPSIFSSYSSPLSPYSLPTGSFTRFSPSHRPPRRLRDVLPIKKLQNYQAQELRQCHQYQQRQRYEGDCGGDLEGCRMRGRRRHRWNSRFALTFCKSLHRRQQQQQCQHTMTNSYSEVDTDHCGRLQQREQKKQRLRMRANNISVETNDAAERLDRLCHCSPICQHLPLPRLIDNGEDDGSGEQTNDDEDDDDRLTLENTGLSEEVIRDDDRDFYRHCSMRLNVGLPHRRLSSRSRGHREPPHHRRRKSCQQPMNGNCGEDSRAPSPPRFFEKAPPSLPRFSKASVKVLHPKPRRPTEASTTIPQKTRKKRTFTSRQPFDSEDAFLRRSALRGCGGRNWRGRNAGTFGGRSYFGSHGSSRGKKKFSFYRSKNNVAARRRFGGIQELHFLLHEPPPLPQHLRHDRGQFLSAALSQWTNWKVAYSIYGFSALSKPP